MSINSNPPDAEEVELEIACNSISVFSVILVIALLGKYVKPPLIFKYSFV
jgi:hypothetical protein